MEGLHLFQLVPPLAEALLVLQVEARREARAHILRIKGAQIRTVILIQIRQEVGHATLLSHFCTGYRPLNEMRIQEKEAGMPRVTIFITNQVEGHMIFAACYPYILFYFEQFSNLLEILRLYGIEAKSDRYQHKNGLLRILPEICLDFIQEYVCIKTNMYSELLYRCVFAVEIPQNNRNHLWSIPLAGLHFELFLAFVAYAVETEWVVSNVASWIIVHK